MNVQLKSEEPHATTTEELIVQYLDGELVRKELETMLFERLAQSAEARGLLREYLTMRGAIRMSYEDEQFQLSSDLDARTRERIENVLGTISIEEPATAGRRGVYAADAKPIATDPAARSMKRWSLRPSIAALALLLAIGGTWLVTRETTKIGTAPQLASNAPVQTAPAQTATQQSQVTIPGVSENVKPTAAVTQKNSFSHTAVAVKQNVTPTQEFAQTTQPVAAQPTATQESQDPADIMLSHRYAKMLNANSTEKREVVITSHDRL